MHQQWCIYMCTTDGLQGAVASQDSTGKPVQRGTITKAGIAQLRRVVMEGTWAYPPTRNRSYPAQLPGGAPGRRQRNHLEGTTTA